MVIDNESSLFGDSFGNPKKKKKKLQDKYDSFNFFYLHIIYYLEYYNMILVRIINVKDIY